MAMRRARQTDVGFGLCGAATLLWLTVAVVAGQDGTAVPVPGGSGAATRASETYRNVYNGWKWWHVYCYRCHGVNAVGTTNAPNLSDPGLMLTSAEFLKIVRNGVPDKGMQAWNKLLDDKQIGQIQLYVRARTDKVLPAGRPDEVGPNGGLWVPPPGWPER